MEFVSGLKNLGPAKENFFVHLVSCEKQICFFWFLLHSRLRNKGAFLFCEKRSLSLILTKIVVFCVKHFHAHALYFRVSQRRRNLKTQLYFYG